MQLLTRRISCRAINQTDAASDDEAELVPQNQRYDQMGAPQPLEEMNQHQLSLQIRIWNYRFF
jgi:hypothetical protein